METRPLREIRESQNMTKTALAHMTGCSTSTLNYLENGDRPARGDTMRRIAAALGVEVLQVEEFARTLGVGQRKAQPDLGAEELYSLYRGDETFRRYAESRVTLAGAEVIK